MLLLFFSKKDLIIYQYDLFENNGKMRSWGYYEKLRSWGYLIINEHHFIKKHQISIV